MGKPEYEAGNLKSLTLVCSKTAINFATVKHYSRYNLQEFK